MAAMCCWYGCEGALRGVGSGGAWGGGVRHEEVGLYLGGVECQERSGFPAEVLESVLERGANYSAMDQTLGAVYSTRH